MKSFARPFQRPRILRRVFKEGIVQLMCKQLRREPGFYRRLMALALPLVLPMLLAVMRASKLSLDGVAWSVTSTYFLGLILLDVITITLAWVLFPYLWRD